MTEHAANFPYLSCMLLAPFTGLLILLILKEEQKFLIRAVSLVSAGTALGLAIFTFVTYDKALGGLQFVEKYEWVKTFGITYFVGVEGLNAPMLLLTGIVIFTGVLTMWELQVRVKEYFIWMLALVTGVFGVFYSLCVPGGRIAAIHRAPLAASHARRDHKTTFRRARRGPLLQCRADAAFSRSHPIARRAV